MGNGQLPLVEVARHLLAALAAGAIIGTERTFHGRAAGFRTHALVCMASSMLMLVSLFQSHWFSASEAVRMDPTRMAQGIMTGIGFLGAGVIFKEGLTVRGLTTAASIWTTSAIGILMGIGFYGAGALATILTLGVLSVFRLIERRFPVQIYAQSAVRFAREGATSEKRLRELLAGHGFSIVRLSYRLCDHEQCIEYQMAVRTLRMENLGRLAETLGRLSDVRGFTLSPSGD